MDIGKPIRIFIKKPVTRPDREKITLPTRKTTKEKPTPIGIPCPDWPVKTPAKVEVNDEM